MDKFLFIEKSGLLVILLSNESGYVSGDWGKVLQHLTFFASVDSKLIILMNFVNLVDFENHISRLFLDYISVEDIPVVPSAINGC